jgi:hypothetical protein
MYILADTNVCFSVGGEEILRLEESGVVFLQGEVIAKDPSIYRDFLKRHELDEFSRTVDVGALSQPSIYGSPYGPGTITFQIEGEVAPILRLDLAGVRVRDELTEDPKKILPALREFLDKALGVSS